MFKTTLTTGALATLILISGCSFAQQDEIVNVQPKEQKKEVLQTDMKNETPQPQVAVDPDATPAQAGLQTLAKPHDVAVLVNKQYSLPQEFTPKNLVYPKVDFIFNEKIEKRMMRKEAAQALEKLFAAGAKENMHFKGVSAYRSHSTQESIFNNYVARDGLEKARTYSALPGTSEHETGLAIDVTTADGACAAQDCFGDTKEAKWLAKNAHKHGFIIRFMKGKEHITGYKYEPWHIRYVGVEVATEIYENGLTLEEYYNAIPVDAQGK